MKKKQKSKRIYGIQPRWFEYPLFFFGGEVGTTLIISKNWNEPW